jgi:hypothetical protein
VTYEEQNHAVMIDSLTYDNWFDLLPLIVDTYHDQGRYDEGEAVKYVLEHRWRPSRLSKDVEAYRWTATMGYASSKQAQKQVSVKFRDAVNRNDYEEKIGVLLQAFIDVCLSGIKPDEETIS